MLCRETIRDIVSRYALEAKRQLGASLKAVVLYGSCAREDYDDESDIDILVLLDVPPEMLPEARSKMGPMADHLDWQYDIVISAVFQSFDIFNKYKGVSGFYKNIEREGLIIG